MIGVYLTFLLLLSISSAGTGIYAITKVVNVSNGFSLLDPDISSGLKIRKWFLSCVAACNMARFIGTFVESVVIFQLIMTETQSMFSDALERGYYRGDVELDAIPTCRALPTALYLSIYFFAALYFARLNCDLIGGRFYIMKHILLTLMLLSFICCCIALFVMENQVLVDTNFIVFKVLLFFVTSWYVVGLMKHFSENPRAGAQKVVDRFYLFAIIVLFFLLLGNIFHGYDIYLQQMAGESTFFGRSTIQFIGMLLYEVLPSMTVLLLLSDMLPMIEKHWTTKVEAPIPKHFGITKSISKTWTTQTGNSSERGTLVPIPSTAPQNNYNSISTSENNVDNL